MFCILTSWNLRWRLFTLSTKVYYYIMTYVANTNAQTASTSNASRKLKIQVTNTTNLVYLTFLCSYHSHSFRLQNSFFPQNRKVTQIGEDK